MTMPDATTHPSVQELSDFGLGRLPEAAAATVAEHLETCPACQKAVAELAPDSFLGKVRASRPNPASVPGGYQATPTETAAPPEGLPPDLANYPKYRFLRELGRGGMGVVYLAEQTLMKRRVAIKVINPGVLAHPSALPRFQAEVQAAATLDHANIVRAHDAEQVGGLHLLVMEFVDGTNLADLVQRKGPLPMAHACHFIRQAALGLQHAFEQGMIHRDIKPQNLMVTAKGQVKILDFGLARLRSSGRGLTEMGSFMGTPEYVSPEQATDAHTADTRADLYSLGCTLFFLLTGRPPFPEDTAVKTILAHIEKEAPPVQELRPEVPAELSAVVARLLAKDPAQRFQTPVELAQALVPFVKQGAKREAVSPPPLAMPVSERGTALGGNTSKILKARENPASQPPVAPAAGEDKPASPFADLAAAAAPPRNEKRERPVSAALAAWYRRPPLLAGAAAAVLALGLGAWLVGGIIVKLKTNDGILVVEVNEANPDLYVDGDKVTVSWGDGGKRAEIRVKPGTRTVELKKEGFTVYGEKVEISDGKRWVLTATLSPSQAPGGGVVPPPDRPGWVDENWIREVSALPVEQQVAAVRAELQARNPGFDGPVKHRSEQGVVTEFGFDGATVHDLSPLLAFSGLQELDCSCKDPWQSPLGDLSPLSPLPLRSLRYPYHTWLGAEPLRSIKTLTTVNDRPAATFWKEAAAEAEDFAKFQKMVAVLTSEGQRNAVANRLKERNPGFDGKVTAKVEDGVVTELQLVTDHVTDISPVRALTGLRMLQCNGSSGGKRQLADLSPLKGMPLTSLNCHYTRVSDLSPLKDMKLTSLYCPDTPVSDLSPLKGMPLTVLDCHYTRVSDLAPLKGMPLTVLSCWFIPVSDLSPLTGMPLTHLDCRGIGVSDLSPLKGMPLTFLHCGEGTRVSDLSPLKGMPLTFLRCDSTPVSDLSPLKGMKLTALQCNGTRVSDLSPLKGMPLKEIHCNFRPERDAGILRSITTLEKINGKPAAQFRQEVATKVPPPAAKVDEAGLESVAGLPSAKQVEAVAQKLRDLNPGFDGKTESKIEGGQVVSLKFCTDNVTNISPVGALPRLRELYCGGTYRGKRQLADLTPLQGMKLTHLHFAYASVRDLSPLKDMKLTFLDFGYTRISDLSPLKDMRPTQLVFAHMPVNDTGLAQLQAMSSLRHLRIFGVQLTDAGLVHLKDLTGLESLTLGRMKLTGAGLMHLQGMSRLRYLGLYDTAVTDAALAHLKGLPSLRVLELQRTRVTDAGLEHLVGLKNLGELRLEGTAVTAAGVASLRKALPNCRVTAPDAGK
jgi:serine/threonine protein kinase/Leucine-rich repeat (LRR) protein